MKIPVYPDDFFSYKDGIKISNEEINKWIKKAIVYMEMNKANDYLVSSGDTLLYVWKDNKGVYNFEVCRGHENADTLDYEEA